MLQMTALSATSTVHGSFRFNEKTRKAAIRLISSSDRKRSTRDLQHILVTTWGVKARRLIPEI